MTGGQLLTPSALLAEARAGPVDPGRDWWGFGGVHGGLIVALLANAMREHASGATLRSVTGLLHRPVRSAFDITVDERHGGRTASLLSADAVVDGEVLVRAVATFSAATDRVDGIAPRSPIVAPPESCEPFAPPLDMVPFARHTEIHPTSPERPFAGGRTATLTAWLRLVDDDVPPDPIRLVVLMDALAPSYSAVLTTPVLIPTVELTVRPTGAIAPTPWILLRAHTRSVSGSWVDERLDGWGSDGTYLGSASQLRVVLDGR